MGQVIINYFDIIIIQMTCFGVQNDRETRAKKFEKEIK